MNDISHREKAPQHVFLCATATGIINFEVSPPQVQGWFYTYYEQTLKVSGELYEESQALNFI